jgi:hypothetical protein
VDENEMLRYMCAYSNLTSIHPKVDWQAKRGCADANKRMFAAFSRSWTADEKLLSEAYGAFKRCLVYRHDDQA